RLTGCRPQDVCGLRPCDISRTPEIPVNIPLPEGKALPVRALEVEGVLVWVYAPRHDKTMHLGKPRAVAMGPAAHRVLLPLLEGRDPAAFVFSPAESRAWLHAQMRARRKRPVQPSQQDRRVENPRKAPVKRLFPRPGAAISCPIPASAGPTIRHG